MASKPKSAEYSDIARDIAANSIVTDAIARLIEQIIEEIHESTIKPLRTENKRLTKENQQWQEAAGSSFVRAELEEARAESAERKLAMAVEKCWEIARGYDQNHWQQRDGALECARALTELEKADDH